MNEYERWANLEGPEPPGIKELMDAGRDVPDLTPEQEARLERALYAQLAAKQQRRAAEEARKRRNRWVMGSVFTAAAAAAAVLLVVFWPEPLHNAGAPHVKLPASAEPAEPIPAGPPDAGPPASSSAPRRRGKR